MSDKKDDIQVSLPKVTEEIFKLNETFEAIKLMAEDPVEPDICSVKSKFGYEIMREYIEKMILVYQDSLRESTKKELVDEITRCLLSDPYFHPDIRVDIRKNLTKDLQLLETIKNRNREDATNTKIVKIAILDEKREKLKDDPSFRENITNDINEEIQNIKDCKEELTYNDYKEKIRSTKFYEILKDKAMHRLTEEYDDIELNSEDD